MVRAAEFLERAARACVPLGAVGIFDRVERAQDQRLHADIRPHQTGVDANGLRRNQCGQLELPHDTREDPAKDIFAPTLPDAGQRGMIRQRLMQGVADEPADRELHLLRAELQTFPSYPPCSGPAKGPGRLTPSCIDEGPDGAWRLRQLVFSHGLGLPFGLFGPRLSLWKTQTDLISSLGFGFATAASPENLLFCLIGVMLATLTGVLPGIGATATIAMLLPIIFQLEPVSSLIMLAGICYGAQHGGSTTAILINMPGEPSSAMTAIDGYQRHARARRARHWPWRRLAASLPGRWPRFWWRSLRCP